MTANQISEMIKEISPDCVLIPELSDALIGVANDFVGDFRPAYSMEKVFQLLHFDPKNSQKLLKVFRAKIKELPAKKVPIFVTLFPVEVDISKEVLHKFYEIGLPDE